MRFEQFDPLADPVRLQACYEIFVASQRHDDPAEPSPSLAGFRRWWGHGFEGGDPRQAWLATDAGGPAGAYLLELPDRENVTLGTFSPAVAPPLRRRGIGTILLAHGQAQARSAGRTALLGAAMLGSAGEAFAQSAGAAGGLTDVRRVLRTSDLAGGRLAALRAEAAARSAGYSLLTWAGATPDAWADQVAGLLEVMADAPRDASVAAARMDAERVRAIEAPALSAGFGLYSVAARHDGDGRLAALTQIITDPDRPAVAFQALTAVHRPHRGHRLGLGVKVAIHEWLAVAEPAVRQFFTWNAETNEHMIAINEQLGYQVSGRARFWELRFPAAAGAGQPGPGRPQS
jgi:GNAT superfamily N-acetyltransferase